MAERRKNRRTDMASKVVLKKMTGRPTEVSVSILDLSKTGCGFECEEMLQIGDVYETYLKIWTKETIHAFLQIVRIELQPGGFTYGAVFIGMPEMDSSRIETYQTVDEMVH